MHFHHMPPDATLISLITELENPNRVQLQKLFRCIQNVKFLLSKNENTNKALHLFSYFLVLGRGGYGWLPSSTETALAMRTAGSNT